MSYYLSNGKETLFSLADNKIYWIVIAFGYEIGFHSIKSENERISVMNNAIKRTILMLTTLVMLCGLAGCDRSETSSAESGSISSSLTISDNADLSGTQAEFDFDEAVKSITLFGQKISLPCMWSDLSEDFTHDNVYLSSGDNLLCNLLYKGKKIGSVVFGRCDVEHSDEVENKPVVSIIIGFNDYGYPYEDYELPYLEAIGCYTGELELDLGELSMLSTESDIKAKLGEPDTIEEGAVNRHHLDYDYDNGYLYFCINDGTSRQGRIIEFYIYADSD